MVAAGNVGATTPTFPRLFDLLRNLSTPPRRTRPYGIDEHRQGSHFQILASLLANLSRFARPTDESGPYAGFAYSVGRLGGAHATI